MSSCLHDIFTLNPLLCHIIMNISKGSSLRLLMVPLGYDGHMFARIGLSSSSLEETIASSSNMDLTQLTTMLLMLC